MVASTAGWTSHMLHVGPRCPTRVPRILHSRQGLSQSYEKQVGRQQHPRGPGLLKSSNDEDALPT